MNRPGITKKSVAALVVVLFVACAALVLYFQDRNDGGASTAAGDFATKWSAGHLDEVTYASTSGADVMKNYATAVGNMGAYPVHVVAHKTSTKGSEATSSLSVSWMLGGVSWDYDTKVRMTKRDGVWHVQWIPSIVQPSLTPTSHLSIERTQPKRADILGLNDQPIVSSRPVINVGLTPRNVKNVDTTSKQLASLLKIDAGPIAKQVMSSKPDAFVSVITLRKDDYDAKKDAIEEIAGTTAKEDDLALAPSRQFASALLGRSGPATADVIKATNGRYKAGDVVGLSGLQQQYDEQLAGTAGVNIELIDDSLPPKSLFGVEPKQGAPLRTTLDTKTQQAADAAIEGSTKPTSFVAMRASTGEVLAVSNGPETGGVDRALTGRYPPGSSFKVITTYALLQHGVKPDDDVACPPTIAVNGRTFKNAEDEAFGSAPFHTDFAKSCNTAFIGLSSKVNGSTLPNAASDFGIGNKWNVGVPAFSGSVPEPKTDVDLAATSFGQGRVLVSPLAMANVAAGVASGTSHDPFVVRNDKNDPSKPKKLDDSTVEQMRPLMREVVTSGTATAANGAAGGDVFGKTGTAEFGTDNPPKAHAWFIGFQGDVAFAVFIEGGEFGGDNAAPLAKKFLDNLSS